jgi:hypothetical protein
MKLHRRIALAALAVALVSIPLAAEPPHDDAAVRAPLEHYLLGHATGDPEHFRKAFHPEAKLFWVRNGELMQRSSDEFIAGATGKPAPDEAQRKRRIVSIDVSGDVASAKIELDYPGRTFIDYMSLVRLGDEWKIINKTYVAHVKPAAE